jgi:Secretion system C-terminal sorting domain
MKKTLLLSFFILTGLLANAQTSFYNYVNEPNIASSNFFSWVATSSGYVFAGSANNLIFDSHLFFARTSTTGSVQQMRSFQASGYNNFSCVIQTIDGKTGYYGTELDGSTFIGSLVLLKLDIVGNYLITKTYSDPNYSFTARKMFQDSQGNFYLLATASNTQTFETSICLIKTDPSGTILDQKLFNPGFDLDAMDIISTAGNGILLTGYADNGTSIESIVLIKLNANLNIDWSKWFNDSTIKYFHYDIKEKANGNFILCGRYDDTVNPFNTLIMEVDNAGNQVWAKKYAGLDGSYSYGYSIALTSTGSAVVSGVINTSPGIGPMLAMSVDANNGNLNWSKFINSGANETIYEMQVTSSGDIIACGSRNGSATILKADATFDLCVDSVYPASELAVTLTTGSINPVATAAALVSGSWTTTPASFTTPLGDACLGVGINEAGTLINFEIYPNPSNDNLTIKSDIPLTAIKVFDAMGKMVLDLNVDAITEISINTSTLSNGVYSLQLMTGQQMSTVKFIKSE